MQKRRVVRRWFAAAEKVIHRDGTRQRLGTVHPEAASMAELVDAVALEATG